MGFRSWLGAPSSPFQPPTVKYRLYDAPLHTLIALLHRVLVYLRGSARPTDDPPIRVVCVSDTHEHKPALPPGDLLIHAGDLSNRGTVSELQAQLDWLSSQPHTHVVCIAGNHDSYFDPRSRVPADRDRLLNYGRVRYLQHSKLTLKFPERGGRELVLYGAPQIPACGGNDFAFQYARGNDAWSGTVPDTIDVLVTHTPPKWHRDLPAGLGCEYLLGELWRVRPRLHVFGHVHAGRGMETVYWDSAQRAYERIAARQQRLDLLRVGFWLEFMRVLLFDTMGIVWTQIWGADADASTVMVNSAVVDWKNNLQFEAQAVDI